MKRTRVAVVGVGSLGQHHARIYAELPQAELVAVIDSAADRARRIGEQYGCRALTDYNEVVEQVEAVSVATPTNLHAEVGRFFLERGIHVLVEKPIASDLGEADDLIEAAQKGGVVLHVGHTERFNPALVPIRPLITTPQFFEAHRLGVFVPRSLDIDVVLDLMIHDLDMILHLTDSMVTKVHAVGIPVLTPRVDIANARLEFQNGCIANVTASRVSKEKIRKLRFFQPHDYISIDFHQQAVEMYSLVNDTPQPRIIERTPAIDRSEPLRRELVSFLSNVNGQPEAIACTGQEAKKALSVALDILDRIA
jgi:predicted dehydrogenase